MTSKKNTKTGTVMERMVPKALDCGGYTYKEQEIIGFRPGGGKHKIDLLATSKKGDKFLISLKWQQVRGTTDQKVPYEVICLGEILQNEKGKYKKAYIVIGGNGWNKKLKEFYLSGGLKKHLNTDNIIILSFEDFIAHANNGKL